MAAPRPAPGRVPRPHLLRLIGYTIVSAVVLTMPFSFAAPRAAATLAPLAAADLDALFVDEPPRVGQLPRFRDVLMQHRTPLTLTSDGKAEIRTYEVEEGDNLVTIAAHFGVTPDTIAYNNGISTPLIHSGDRFRIPPVDGAIYKVQAGDSVEKVARFFKVEATSVIEANYLNFEPDNFAPGKEILVPVPSGRFPEFELKRVPQRPYVVSQPISTPTPPLSPAKLAWPVRGVVTQYFWYGHRAVDIAAAYGTTIVAADAGTVSATGWVAVGGLRVCLSHDAGLETCYYHTSAVNVSVGQRVERGQPIATIGMTGVTTGPHVHWEAKQNGTFVNPLAY